MPMYVAPLKYFNNMIINLRLKYWDNNLNMYLMRCIIIFARNPCANEQFISSSFYPYTFTYSATTTTSLKNF